MPLNHQHQPGCTRDPEWCKCFEPRVPRWQAATLTVLTSALLWQVIIWIVRTISRIL